MNPIFCNNKECKLKNTCFRFLCENSTAVNLEYLKRNKCQNYVHWDLNETDKIKIKIK